MSWQDKRMAFETDLENILIDCNDRIDHIEIEWNEADTNHHTAADYVHITFKSGHRVSVNVVFDSFRAIVKDCLKQI